MVDLGDNCPESTGSSKMDTQHCRHATVKDESSFIHVHTSTGAAPTITPTLNRMTLRIKRSMNIGTTDDESQHPKER